MKKRKKPMPAKKTINRKNPTKLKLANSSRFSLRRMLPFVLVFAAIGTVMLWRSFAAENFTDIKLQDTASTRATTGVGTDKMAQYGEVTGTLLTEAFTSRRFMYFRNSSTGASTYVTLPADSFKGYNGARLLMTGSNDLWVYGGSGELYLRHYKLTGTPLPTEATLLETKTFGDTNSRMGDMTGLKSGGITVAWHQHFEADGSSGASQYVAYRSPAGVWQNLPRLDFMATRSSDQVIGQHPADGSVWLFSNPDGWGAVGAARLLEGAGGLTVDWTDGLYIYSSRDGINGSDPENPDLSLAADPANGTLALAYQSAERQAVRDADGKYLGMGSYPVIARIAADKSKSFTQLPIYVERVSQMGLVVGANGDTWLAYRPIKADGSFKEAYVSKHSNGAWGDRIFMAETHDTIGVSLSRPEFSLSTVSDGMHFYTLLASKNDTSAPSAPSGLSASLSSPTQALLAWQASSDNVGVSSYEVYRNNTRLATVPGSATQYSDGNLAADTSYSYFVKALDAAGNISAASNTATVSTPAPPPASTDTLAPSVSISSPKNNTKLSGRTKSVQVSASATDNTGVIKMEVYIDGSLTSTANAGSISYTWDTSRLSKGQHTVLVKAYDDAGNMGSLQVMVKK